MTQLYLFGNIQSQEGGKFGSIFPKSHRKLPDLFFNRGKFTKINLCQSEKEDEK